MAGSSKKESGGGCAVLIAIALAIAAVLFLLSTIGHVLGLTPTFSEITDRPDGWVDRHYRGVVWGFLLTIVALVAVAGLAFVALSTARQRGEHNWTAYATVTVMLLAAIVLLPIGKRPGVDTAPNAVGTANEGQVPRVVGLDAEAAEEKLSAASFDASFAADPYEPRRCKVVKQRPAPGSELDQDDTTVRLRCVVDVPRLVGRSPERAQRALERRGIDSRLRGEPADFDLSRCRVARQSAVGRVAPDATVGLRLRCPPPPPAPEPEPVAVEQPPAEQGCDPNYEGQCLDPNSPDYDCAGGSGDGPDYTGRVIVVGDDHYGLDTGGEPGIGCESG